MRGAGDRDGARMRGVGKQPTERHRERDAVLRRESADGAAEGAPAIVWLDADDEQQIAIAIG